MKSLEISAFAHGGTLVVDSRLIAKRLGIKHRSFLKTIRKHQGRLEQRLGQLRFEITPVKNEVGAVNNATYFLLAESQATALMTLSRNTEQVVECKLDLVEAFEKAKEVIQKLNPHGENLALEAWVLNKPRPWDEHYFPEWRKEAERLTGWSWGWQCMSKFINSAVYDWMPKAVRDRLDEVNPTDDRGRRALKLMMISGSKDEFLRNIKSRHTRAIQPWLF